MYSIFYNKTIGPTVQVYMHLILEYFYMLSTIGF